MIGAAKNGGWDLLHGDAAVSADFAGSMIDASVAGLANLGPAAADLVPTVTFTDILVAAEGLLSAAIQNGVISAASRAFERRFGRVGLEITAWGACAVDGTRARPARLHERPGADQGGVRRGGAAPGDREEAAALRLHAPWRAGHPGPERDRQAQAITVICCPYGRGWPSARVAAWDDARLALRSTFIASPQNCVPSAFHEIPDAARRARTVSASRRPCASVMTVSPRASIVSGSAPASTRSLTVRPTSSLAIPSGM